MLCIYVSVIRETLAGSGHVSHSRKREPGNEVCVYTSVLSERPWPDVNRAFLM